MSVIPFPQKQYNAPIAANDNIPQDESGASAGFGVVDIRDFGPRGSIFAGGQYIGLTRRFATPFVPHTDDRPQPPRKGDYMQTYTGRQYWPVDPHSDEVVIEDIAHSLSLQCRYAGHCILFYSVAEHSVHVAQWLRANYGPLIALHGLLHDATETYCVDVPRPLKPFLSNYKDIEQRNWEAIAKRFGLSSKMPEEVHEADGRIIADELVNLKPMDWHSKWDDPLGVSIGCWSPAVAEQEFLAEFRKLERAVVERKSA